jgi:hypothetical protein
MADRLFDTGDDGSGDGSGWCRCDKHKPYTTPDWGAWVTDRDRAFCRSCGRDLRPADVKKLYAQACAAERRSDRRFPGFDQQVPPPDKDIVYRPTDDTIRAFLRGEYVGSCDRCGELGHVDVGTVVSAGRYAHLCRWCWWDEAK